MQHAHLTKAKPIHKRQTHLVVRENVQTHLVVRENVK
jgi:hypothetical protein